MGQGYIRESGPMNINITHKKESIGLQLFDKWYAYRQSINSSYKSDVSITHTDTTVNDAINIWFDFMPPIMDKRMLDYDLIFLCNGGEALSAWSSGLMKHLSIKENVYLVADVYVAPSHSLYNKIIWHPFDPLACTDYWTRSFYPQFYENHKKLEDKKIANIFAINGENRANRKFFFDQLKSQLPSVAIKDTYSHNVGALKKSLWESPEDREFREYVNSLYNYTTSSPDKSYDKLYYQSYVNVGQDNKFGEIVPGYFILDEYFSHHCAVFPEVSWQNDEVCITEKALKCFYAECIPLPIGGKGTNQLYNSLGLYTAWNLLPQELQVYDDTKDHLQRYQQQINAIKWLNDNPQIFLSDSAIDIKKSNKTSLLTNTIDYQVANRFDQLMQRIYAKK